MSNQIYLFEDGSTPNPYKTMERDLIVKFNEVRLYTINDCGNSVAATIESPIKTSPHTFATVALDLYLVFTAVPSDVDRVTKFIYFEVADP